MSENSWMPHFDVVRFCYKLKEGGRLKTNTLFDQVWFGANKHCVVVANYIVLAGSKPAVTNAGSQ